MARALAPRAVAGRRAVGLWINLYSLRSAHNWGFGDFGDLARLVLRAGRRGYDFVGLNPLHAIRNRGAERSPYSPVSRLYRSPLYLDVTAIPELADDASAQRSIASRAVQRRIERLRAADSIDYDAVRELKEPFLRRLHGAFVCRHRGRDTERGRAYARYCEEQGRGLVDFATFSALEDRLRDSGAGGWHTWPRPLRERRSRAVAAFRVRAAAEVDYHCWVQFEIDRQLGAAAAAARRAGMRVGLYADLAVASLGDGADAWADPALFAGGRSLGAPPDAFAKDGQVWGMPPLFPRRLAARDARAFRALLRASLRHAGALRIDHAIGLVRQYWVRDGRPGRSGRFVAFPAEVLFRALVDETRRARALAVAEDLGAVPRELPGLLSRHGVLGTRVLLFERGRAGTFKAPRRYPARALATATTHDLAPLAGWMAGTDLDLAERLGRFASGAELGAARAARAADVAALAARMRAEGLLAARRRFAARDLVRAAHAFLLRTPCALVAFGLDDVALETEPINVPGVSTAAHPSWSRRMRVPVERIALPRVR